MLSLRCNSPTGMQKRRAKNMKDSAREKVLTIGEDRTVCVLMPEVGVPLQSVHVNFGHHNIHGSRMDVRIPHLGIPVHTGGRSRNDDEGQGVEL